MISILNSQHGSVFYFLVFSEVILPVYLHSSSSNRGLNSGLVWGLFTLHLTLVITLLSHMVNTNMYRSRGHYVDFNWNKTVDINHVGIYCKELLMHVNSCIMWTSQPVLGCFKTFR